MTRPKRPEEKQRDAERTRGQIVEAARAVFARDGFEGARLEEVAREAGISKALIYHYFDDREGLFAHALEAEVLGLRRHQADLELRGLEPMEGIRRLVLATFDYFTGHPGLITFLNIENRLGGAHMRRSVASIQSYDPLLDTLATVLQRGRREGSIREGVEPLALYLSIAGLCYHFVSNRHTLGAVFRRDLSAPEEVARRREEILDFVLHAVAADAGSAQATRPSQGEGRSA